jgi:hypothetical protein
MTKICAGGERLRLAPVCKQNRRGEDVAQMTSTRRHGAPKKQIFPSLLPQPLRASRTISRCQNPRPKFCAARPESVQHGRFGWPSRNEITTDSGRTRSDRQAHRSPPEARIWPADRHPSHQSLTSPGAPNLGIPIIICAAAVRVCAGHFGVSVSCRWNTSISAYLRRPLGTPFDSMDRGIARGGV